MQQRHHVRDVRPPKPLGPDFTHLVPALSATNLAVIDSRFLSDRMVSFPSTGGRFQVHENIQGRLERLLRCGSLLPRPAVGYSDRVRAGERGGWVRGGEPRGDGEVSMALPL